jgi:hypothetical protein
MHVGQGVNVHLGAAGGAILAFPEDGGVRHSPRVGSVAGTATLRGASSVVLRMGGWSLIGEKPGFPLLGINAL